MVAGHGDNCKNLQLVACESECPIGFCEHVLSPFAVSVLIITFSKKQIKWAYQGDLWDRYLAIVVPEQKRRKLYEKWYY